MSKEYSEEYKSIRKEADGWQDWKKETYNVNLATSKHSKKLEIKNCSANADDLLKRYKKELEGLTVGGSEYYDEPERCARDIRERLGSQQEFIKRLIIQRNKIFGLPVIGWIVGRLIKQ